MLKHGDYQRYSVIKTNESTDGTDYNRYFNGKEILTGFVGILVLLEELCRNRP